MPEKRRYTDRLPRRFSAIRWGFESADRGRTAQSLEKQQHPQKGNEEGLHKDMKRDCLPCNDEEKKL